MIGRPTVAMTSTATLFIATFSPPYPMPKTNNVAASIGTERASAGNITASDSVIAITTDIRSAPKMRHSRPVTLIVSTAPADTPSRASPRLPAEAPTCALMSGTRTIQFANTKPSNTKNAVMSTRARSPARPLRWMSRMWWSSLRCLRILPRLRCAIGHETVSGRCGRPPQRYQTKRFGGHHERTPTRCCGCRQPRRGHRHHRRNRAGRRDDAHLHRIPATAALRRATGSGGHHLRLVALRQRRRDLPDDRFRRRAQLRLGRPPAADHRSLGGHQAHRRRRARAERALAVLVPAAVDPQLHARGGDEHDRHAAEQHRSGPRRSWREVL